jgi:hypothetical protein
MDMADFEAWFGRVDMVRQGELSNDKTEAKKALCSPSVGVKRG